MPSIELFNELASPAVPWLYFRSQKLLHVPEAAFNELTIL